MYAVIKTGGKQYRVAKDDIIEVELLDTAKKGDKVTLDEVLLVGAGGSAKVGTPTVSGAAVTAEVLDQKKDDKVIVFKKKRRQNYRRKNGHRQNLTVLKIKEIKGA
ncbi:MAG: 50S ribosomal protein L21 [Alphaproteobacteria bacterium]|nr:50S ribosomal protein L21 [Alphaproteobacteria bacterium]